MLFVMHAISHHIYDIGAHYLINFVMAAIFNSILGIFYIIAQDAAPLERVDE